MSMIDRIDAAREAWRDRAEHARSVRLALREAPSRWREADRGRRTAIVAVLALFAISMALLIV